MYQGLHMWDEALSLAEAKGHSNLEDMRTAHAKWLLETGQEETAGTIKESEGDYREALNLYLRAGLATRWVHQFLGSCGFHWCVFICAHFQDCP